MRDCNPILVDMMFEGRPIKEFENLLISGEKLPWDHLLNMCYWEERYESVGGDEGYLENPPIDYGRLAYLRKLIDFLESNGIKLK